MTRSSHSVSLCVRESHRYGVNEGTKAALKIDDFFRHATHPLNVAAAGSTSRPYKLMCPAFQGPYEQLFENSCSCTSCAAPLRMVQGELDLDRLPAFGCPHIAKRWINHSCRADSTLGRA